MKKFSIIATSAMIAMGMVGIAHADLNNWTGFYAGVNGGVVFNDIDLKSQQLGFNNPSEHYNTHSDFASFFPGVQFGYMRQFPNYVLGVEANATFNVNQDDTLTSRSNINPNIYDRFTFTNQLQASIRGRLGRALDWHNNIFLPYLTAGVSFANLELTYQNEATDYYSTNTIQPGWLIGAGVEWPFKQKWSLRAEYYYANYGNAIKLNIPSVYGLLDPNGAARVSLSSNNVMVALNYWI